MWRGGWHSSEKRRRRCMRPSALSCGLHSSGRGRPMILFTIFILRGFLRPKPALRKHADREKRKWRGGEKMSGKLIVDSESPLLWYASFKLQMKISLFIFCTASGCESSKDDFAAGTEILLDTHAKLDSKLLFVHRGELKYIQFKLCINLKRFV